MAEPTRPPERLLWALQERAKELACLYEVEECCSHPETPLDEVLRCVIRAIPPGWQHPELCQVKIQIGETEYATEGYVDTPWCQTTEIVAQDRVVGRLWVSYREEAPVADEGPFLKEEARLIRTIADRLGHFIQHQQLRVLVQEWRAAHDALAEQGTREWRVALNLLRRSDQDMFVRISRKLANHLSWSGVAEAQELLQGFVGLRGLDERVGGEKNLPIQRRELGDPLQLADRVFSLAARHMQDDEIMRRIQRWIQEDRAGFLVKAVVDQQSSPTHIADAIRRFQQMGEQGVGLSRSWMHALLVILIRRFLSDEPAFVAMAKDHVALEDFPGLFERLVSLPGSPGRVGGKAAGLFVAYQVLRRAAEAGVDLGPIRIPKTWYVASDTVHAFVLYNHLEELYEQKYKDVDQVRMEYPHLIQVFKNSEFPPEIVKGLSMALDDLHDGPLIVRSSSLLEDRAGAIFSGKYKSLFLHNRGSKQERLAALLDAVAEVYASIFGPDPIQYRAERGLLHLREEMGIMIQEVVGARIGPYWAPAFAGVGFSHNEFRWSSRLRREDGLLRLVPGLGTRAVDRVREDYPVLVAPGQPSLRVNVTTDEVLRYSPRTLDVIDLEQRTMATLDMKALLREHGHDYPALHRLVSVRDGDRLTRPSGLLLDPERDDLVVTFDGLINATPFVRQFSALLKALQAATGHAVDVEFASDGRDLYVLQCRPQSHAQGAVAARIPADIPESRLLFSANRFVSNGLVPDITHIVYVDGEAYSGLRDLGELQAVGRAVSRLNATLPRRQFILMGPGRWGSRGDIKLGVNVTYSDINNAAMLIEVARSRGGLVPDLSFGTHFFQDLVEASIRYLPLYPDDPGVVFAESFFLGSDNRLAELAPEFAHLAGVVRVIEVPAVTKGKVLRVLQNAEIDRAVGVLVEPSSTLGQPEGESAGRGDRDEHWRWRLAMAERIAASLDGARFGVVAAYVLGSTKNATAGPCSDIDLVLHVRGTEEQRQALRLWLEGWSLALDELNFARVGARTGGLLDVHFVTDEDIAARTSFAVRIGASTDPARELKLKGS
ncbi:MAG TPA: PEP/pyruvate-binding domain-containing protein [Thermoanaerobaculaceae bacterium]|nr:PEP/pyruvate-binding domain-containing protein [Thermoanaerobaculaceae bacterium]HRS14913.1 PEP/pyruvate-binding domain-containing protein [Thermoanaerobaculaceae bacterium]